MHVAKSRMLATVSGQPRAIFLHTTWRSGGTWLWSRCREQAQVHALYEPLHERLGRLRRADIRALRPGSWASNHSDTPPYFQEYAPLLGPGARGVPQYQQRFAFDDFFLDPDDGDQELETYLHTLLAMAEPGQVSVLKFCRSLGRTGWFQRRFPSALHAVVMRDPVAQWASAEALLTKQRNRYFAIAPLLVLARNAAHPLVRDAVAALDVSLPDLHSRDFAYGVETTWRHLRRTGAEERYRSFLAFWTACAIQAARSRSLMVDTGRIAGDAAYRGRIEAALGAGLGHEISLQTQQPPLPAAADAGRAAAHRSAAALVGEHARSLQPDQLAEILHTLAAQPDSLPRRPHPTPIRQPRDQARSPGQRLTTKVAVLSARALHAIRRLHGALARLLDQIT